jgi:NADPH:quinone reductase-like Zn-dependent oxidoreductase
MNTKEIGYTHEDELSFAQLSALVYTGTTAWNTLYGNVPLKSGQTVLFLGKERSFGCQSCR